MKRIILFILLLQVNYTNVWAQVNKPKDNPQAVPTQSAVLPSDYTGNINLNYVRTIVPMQAAATETDLFNLRLMNRAVESTTYTDGFLRPLQTVTKKSANTYFRDMVVHYNYDASGRVVRNLLPFSKGDQSTAAENKFDKQVYTDLRQTYNRMGYTDESFLYSETVYEQSLLGRALEQRAPGNAWTGNAKGITVSSRKLLASDNLYRLKVDVNFGEKPLMVAPYTQEEATVNITTDEDGTTRLDFYDFLGRHVASESAGLRTYKVYDMYNRLRYNVSAKAVEELNNNGWNFNQTILDELCFRYEYDARGNMILLKKPGVGAQEFVYNDDNQLMLSRDAEQSAANKWVFYKYDVYGRLVQQGIYTHTGSGSVTPNANDYLGKNLSVNSTPSTLLGYLFNYKVYKAADYVYSFPNTEFYLHYYFDDYTFFNLLTGSQGYTLSKLAFTPAVGNATEGYDKEQGKNARGLLTGIYTSVSDNSAKLARVNYYNSRGELIQSLHEDLYGNMAITGLGYDYAGRMIKSVFQTNTLTIQKKYTYDQYGRIRFVSHKAGASADYRRLAQYDYDELGRLKTKYLGSMKYPVSYEYNIRNWITGINKQYAENPSNSNLYFGEILHYNTGYEQTYLNGRLAGMQWRTKGSSDELRSYGYLYDAHQQLNKADYYFDSYQYSPDKTEWGKVDKDNHTKDFTAENMTYDANGNILSMRHYGMDAAGHPIILDDLNYTYDNQSNRLLAVSESASSESVQPDQHDGLGDFRDATGSQDYMYDANGNVKADLNRGIMEIKNTWFNLNKPLKSTQAANQNNWVEYVYDATGVLLRKKVSNQPNLVNTPTLTILDYVGEITFENQVPVTINHEEGRIRYLQTPPMAPVYQYDYYLKDHLDNIRCIVAESPTEGLFDAIDPATYNPNNNGNTTFNPLGATDPVGYIATSEVANNPWESQLFERIGETRDTRPGPPEPGDYNAAELSATSGVALGPGKLIRVMAGDKIQLGAEAFFYSSANPDNPMPITSMVAQVINAMMATASVTGEVANSFAQASINGSQLSLTLSNLQQQESDTSKPKAYLNYLMFDDGFNLMPDESGVLQVNQANAWQNMDVPQFDIGHNGYLYVFTSNQSQGEVHTDNLYIYHWQSRLLEEFNYYPYGLTFEVSKATNVRDADARYNTQSIQRNEFMDANGDPYGQNWYDFMARSYDMQIGRWMQPDPMMQYHSPYLAMGNNPSIYTDPTGLFDGDDPKKKTVKYYWDPEGKKPPRAVADEAIAAAYPRMPSFDNSNDSYRWDFGGGGAGTAGGMLYTDVPYDDGMSVYYMNYHEKVIREDNRLILANQDKKYFMEQRSFNKWDYVSNASGILSTKPTINSTWMYNDKMGDIRWTGKNGIHYTKSQLRMNGGYMKSMELAKNSSKYANLSKVGNGLTLLSVSTSLWSAYKAVQNGSDNTSTWVGLTVGVGGAILTVVGSPAIVTGAAIAGAVWGISQMVAGDEINGAIDDNFGYK